MNFDFALSGRGWGLSLNYGQHFRLGGLSLKAWLRAGTRQTPWSVGEKKPARYEFKFKLCSEF